MDEFNQLPDALLDSALNELPVAPLPSGFNQRVLADVLVTQRTAVSSTPIRYRLQFLDIALASFWSLTLIVIFLATLWGSGLLQPEWLPQAQTLFTPASQLHLANNAILLAGIALLVLEMSILGLVGVNVLGERHPA